MNIPGLADILKDALDAGAFIAKSCMQEDITACNEKLISLGHPPLPEDYAAFLRIVGGFAWNGHEFFGPKQARDAESSYTLQDIARYNEGLSFAFDEGILAIGTFDDDVYVYDANQHVYQALDRTTWFEIETYASFADLFGDTVVAYLPDENDSIDEDEEEDGA